MLDKQQALAEAYRRGILPPEKAAAYEEAINRGLIGQQVQPESNNPDGTMLSRGITDLGRGFERGLDKAATGLIQVGVDTFGGDKAQQFFENKATELNNAGRNDDSTLATVGDFAGEILPSFIGGAGAAKAGIAAAKNAPRLAGIAKTVPKFIQRGAAGAAGGVATAIAEAREQGESRMDKIAPYAALGGAGAAVLPIAGAGALAVGKGALKGAKATPELTKEFLQDPSGSIGLGFRKTGEAVKDTAASAALKLQDNLTLSKQARTLPRAQRTLVRMVQRGNLDVDGALKRIDEAKAQGIDLPLYEAFDDPMMKRTAKMLLQGSEGSSQAKDAIDVIQGRLPESISNVTSMLARDKARPADAGRALSLAANDMITKAQEQLQRRASKEYAKAIKVGNVVDSDTLNHPHIQKVIQQVRGDTLRADVIGNVADNDMTVLHQVQQKLSDQIQVATRGGEQSDARILTELRTKLMDDMGKAYPSFKEATRLYRDDATVLNGLENSVLGAIRDLAENVDPSVAVDKLFKLSPQEIGQVRAQMSKAGLTDTFEEAAASGIMRVYQNTLSGRFGTFSNKIKGKEQDYNRLRALVGGEKAKRIDTFFESFDRAVASLGVKGGSDTAANQAAVSAMKNSEVQESLSGVRNILTIATNTKQAIAEGLFNAANDTILQDPDGAQKLVRYMFTRDGERLLRKLQKDGTLKQKAVTMEQILTGAAATGGVYGVSQ